MLKDKNIVLTGCNSGIGYEFLQQVLPYNKVFAVDKDTWNLDKIKSDNLIVMQQDISTQEGVDAVFDRAAKDLPFIDIFYANAGFPYYEKLDYTDWKRAEDMFETNVFSPIYSYEKYRDYLDGRKGTMAITVSAIGKMAISGFAIYSASKFAMQGFQEALRLELPSNITLTCLYPIATNTNFFVTGNEVKYPKPFPVQSPKHVAKCMVKGIEKGKKFVNPSKLFSFAQVLFVVCPPIKKFYWDWGRLNLKLLEKEKAKSHPRKTKKIY